MKAVLYDAPRSFAVHDVPRPSPGPGDILVKVLQSGICGTDLHIHEGNFFAEFPLIPGHEVVGTVEAADPKWRGSSGGRPSPSTRHQLQALRYCRSAGRCYAQT